MTKKQFQELRSKQDLRYTITLPFTVAQEVIERIRNNSNKVISLIETKFFDNCLFTILHVQYL